ncbi:MAG: response regulator transcription factor [Mangrovicoccus sp.]
MGSERIAPTNITQARVALVDDDRNILVAVEHVLDCEGFEVLTFRDGQSAFEAFSHNPPDIAVIDLVMPRLDGMELVRKIRENWNFPIIMITAKEDEIDEVLGLRMGADDYVHKPFSSRLLVERIRASLRRSAMMGGLPEPVAPVEMPQEPPAETICRGPLTMDPQRHAVSWKGEDVTLTVTEFLLLEALAQRPGYVKSRDQLMDVAYDDQVYVDDRTIDSHIKRLRKKLRAIDPEFAAIETLYGIGYRFRSPEVSALSN